MTGEGSSSPDLSVLCAVCTETVSVRPDAEVMDCAKCAVIYSFRPCSHCGATNQVSSKAGRGGWWQCAFCREKTQIPLLGALEMASAEQRVAELQGRGMEVGLAELKLIGGFTVVGGNGFGLVPSSVCSVLTRPDAAYVRVEIGEGRGRAVTIPYSVMTALQVAGGARTTGRTFFGGGFGLQGALEGMIVASALNAATKRTTINTGMHIGATNGEILLHHGSLEGAVIRNALSPLWTRFEAAKLAATSAPRPRPHDPVELLARLGELRDSGVLSEDEFSAKKAEILSRL